MRIFKTILAMGLMCTGVAAANANSFTFTTTGGEADLTTSAGQVSLTLKDTYVDPGAVSDNLSAFYFTLDGTVGANSLTTPTSGTPRTIAGDGTYTDGTALTTVAGIGWVESSSGNTLGIDVLSGTGHAGPSQTIVGTPGTGGIYDGNSSITGNGPHNPFLDQVVTFTFNIADVTAATNVTATTFQFGTTDGSNQAPGTPGVVVPTPAASMMGGMLLAAMMGIFAGAKYLRAQKA